MSHCPENVQISYEGVLPHPELDETLSKYHVLFFPSTGENFGHIISEAMMNYCIPLISNRTPWRGLGLMEAGFDLAISEPRMFAEKVDYFASLDEDQLEKIAKNANRFVHHQLDSTILHCSYKELFN